MKARLAGPVLLAGATLACADPPAAPADCERAADRLVEIFAAHDPASPFAARMAQRHRHAFMQACGRGSTATQVECVLAATTVAALEECAEL